MWPAGLYLATLALRTSQHPSEDVRVEIIEVMEVDQFGENKGGKS